MTDTSVPSIRPQPMIAVADVGESSRWYQRVLGASSGHRGAEYEQLLVDGLLIMQLHQLEIGHYHGTIGDPQQPVGNGVALWFEASDFDEVADTFAINPVLGSTVAQAWLATIRR